MSSAQADGGLSVAPEPPRPSGWRSWSTGKKAGVVLLCIAGVSLVAIVAGFIYGSWWLLSVGDQVPAVVAAGDETRALFRLHASAEDPGVDELLTLVEERIEHHQAENAPVKLPAPLRKLTGMQTHVDVVRRLWPREVVITFDRDARWVAIVNLSGMGGMVKGFQWGLTAGLEKQGGGEREQVTHRGHVLSVLGEGVVVALVESSILLGSDVDGAKRVIDRWTELLERGEEDAAPELPAALLEPSRRFAQGADAHGVALELARLLGPEGTPGLAAVQLAGVSLDLVSRDLLRVRMTFQHARAEEVEETRQVLEPVLEALVADAAESQLVLVLAQQVSGAELVVEGNLSGVARAVERVIEKLMVPPEPARSLP